MLEIKFDAETDRLTITNNSTEPTSTPPKLYIKPSEDLGELKKIRKFSPERDYLDALRYGLIDVEFVGTTRNFTLNFETGANYSNGIPVKVNASNEALPLDANDSVIVSVTLNNSTLDRDYRFKFEVL